MEQAAALAEKIFARDPKQHAVVHRVAGALLDAGDLDRAQAMLGVVRDVMIDSGEHEAMAQSLTRLSERRPGQIVPFEWLVHLYGRASDSFRLPDALAQLAQAYESAGDDAKAIATYEKLLERTPEDETTRRKYMRLRTKSGMEPGSAEVPAPVKVAPSEQAAQPASPASSEPSLEDETQRYVTQALTDVDLFSSYGLTQKAIDLLELVLERAPRHAPILERLLDLSLGAGNDRRTVELASILEEIAKERNDRPAIERFAELRQRSQRAAGIAPAEAQPPAAPPKSAAPSNSPFPSFKRSWTNRPRKQRRSRLLPRRPNRRSTKWICRMSGRRSPSSSKPRCTTSRTRPRRKPRRHSHRSRFPRPCWFPRKRHRRRPRLSRSLPRSTSNFRP